MKATVRTALKLALATGVAFLAGLVLVLASTRALARRATADRAADILADAVPAEARAACLAGEAPRGAVIPSGAHFAFYDEGGAPLHADAPPLDRELAARTAREARRSAGDFDRASQESRAVVRLDVGRCAWAEARWRLDARALGPAVGATALAAGLAAAMLALFVAGLVVRPLLVRLRGLRRTAASIGTDAFVPAPPWADEAGEIGRALAEAHGRITAATAALAERSASLAWVLAEVGHDVRTPLSSLQLALDDLAEELPADALPVLRRALSDVVYLRSLTANLLLASGLRATAPPAPPGPLDLGAIARRTYERTAPFALRRGIDLRTAIEPGLVVTGHEAGTEQALTNLLENSIAHTDPGTKVRLEARRDGPRARIVIEDDGPGNVPAGLPALGPRTFREDHVRPRDGRGTGLGLAITRAVCERAGWTVRVEPAIPRGFRAVIEAPLAPEGGETA